MLIADASARETLRARSAEVDRAVSTAFERTSADVTVLAVGGYGREELFPYSDVDLLLLTNGAAPAREQRDAISEFLRILWDAGLRVSQSVRTAPECCEIHDGNLELTISLLDRRLLCGEAGRFDDLEQRFPKFLNNQRLTIAHELCVMARGRHAKYQNTIYHLEPNVKEHPGGLRDLHVIHWLAKLRNWEAEEPEETGEFLHAVRLYLHQHYRRDNNLLNFEAQDAIFPSPADWMRKYYRNARSIYRAVTRAIDAGESVNAGLLAQFRDWRGRVSNSEFTVSRERVLLRDPHRLEADPGLLFRLLVFLSRHQLRLSADAERRLASYTPPPPDWKALREFLGLPRCSIALRALHESDLLQKLIPTWERIDCLVVRDFYHHYTVDEHTLIALENLEELAGATGGLSKRFRELWEEIDHPELLRMALLLHDIGKGGGDHVTVSLQVARDVFAQLAMPKDAAGAILFLIEHHLDLSSVMTSRDLDDPATARQIAAQTGTIERLKLLTLMTYADISAVNPGAMTPWRLEQLWHAYRVGNDEFKRELQADRIQTGSGAVNPDVAGFLEGFPTRYARTHSEDEICRHMEMANQGIAVDLVKTNGTWQVIVIGADKPFVLASLSGALASFGLNILKAEAFSNRKGLILDTFVFADPHRTLELNPSEVDRLRDTVARAVSGRLDVAQLLKKRPRQPATGRVIPSVIFNDEVSDTATLVEIVAEDRPGLLYDLAYAISSVGANIEVVLIDTEAHKALDVFYVTAGGRKLGRDVEAILRSNLLAITSQPAK